MPPLQVPVWHQLPAQHRWAGPPQDWHVPDEEDDDEQTFAWPQ
jgi:hypothetical protein